MIGGLSDDVPRSVCKNLNGVSVFFLVLGLESEIQYTSFVPGG